MAFSTALAEALSLFLAGFLIHVLLGPMPRSLQRQRPLFGFPAGLGRRLTAKLDRSARSQKTRFLRGVFVTAFVVTMTAVLALGASVAARDLPQGWIVELGLWVTAFRFTWPWRALPKMASALEDPEVGATSRLTILIENYRLAGHEQVKAGDRHALCRFVLGSTAGSLSRGLFALLIGALVAVAMGLPSLVGLGAVVALSELTQVTPTASLAFRRPFLLLNGIVQRIAALPTSLCICLAALLMSRSSPVAAFKLALGNNFDPRGALAGALGVTLGGPQEGNKWLGAKDTSAKIRPPALRQALVLHVLSVLVALILCSLALMLVLGV